MRVTIEDLRSSIEIRAGLDEGIAKHHATLGEAERVYQMQEPALRAASEFVADCNQKADNRAEAPQERA